MPTYHIDPASGNDANDGLGWYKLAYANGLGVQPVAGETVTGAGGATAKIISVTGTWATSGTLYLYNRNGTAFANGENITFSGGGSCTNAQGTPYDAVNSAFKTDKKTFAAGDTVKSLKCVETAQSGTATATTGSVSVTGISGWTPAQYDIIRFDSDTTIYMVRAWTAGTSTITLYRPYRGTTGGGKVISKLTLFTGMGDYGFTAGTGTAANPITWTGGVNPATNLQDGFTILGGQTYGLGYAKSHTFWNFSRLGFYNCQYTFGGAGGTTHTDCTFTDCFAFRGNLDGTTFVRPVFNTFVSEQPTGDLVLALRDAVINGIETGSAANFGIRNGGMYNSVIYNWKNAGYASAAALNLGVSGVHNVRFVDAILDELATHCINVEAGTMYNAAISTCAALFFQNPQVSTGAMVSLATGAGGHFGTVAFAHVNGVEHDHRLYYLYGSAIFPYSCREDLVYHTAAPSARVNLLGHTSWIKEKFYIPCDAGVQKTISAWLMKNSNPITTPPTVNAAGSDYAVGDLLTVTQAGAGGAILRVATISGSGVATLTVISGGFNHAIANGLATVALTGGGDNACTVNITAVGAGYGSSNLPFMRLRWMTGTAPNLVSNVYDVAMANTDNAFQQVSHAITPSITGMAILELHFYSAGAGALVWYDDFGVA